MNTDVQIRIGRNIKILREKAGLTQDALAIQLQLKGCDITRSALAKIEVAQRHIYVDEIILLKELLNVSFEELLK